MQILGHTFSNVKRIITLTNYRGTKANPIKIFHIVMSLNSNNTFTVEILNGRKGSALRRQVVTFDSSEHVAHTLVTHWLNKCVKEGYVVSSDESYSNTIELPELPEETLNEFTHVWTPAQYVENPIREIVVNASYSLDGYAVAFIPKSKRVIVSIVNGVIRTYNHHGGELSHDSMPEGFWSALSDITLDIVLDGFWDSEHYWIVDSPSEIDYEVRYREMLLLIGDLIDNDVVQFADVYFNQNDIAEALETVHSYNVSHITGIKKTGQMRPGQKDGARIQLMIHPRVDAKIIGKNGTMYDLGVDDGLGFIKVCQINSDIEMKIDDCIVIEYEGWNGYGSMLENPQIIQKHNQPVECSIEQLLATA